MKNNKNKRLQFSNPYIKNKFILCFTIAIIATIIGAAVSLAFKQFLLGVTSIVFIAYFLFEACEIVANDRAGRYVVISAILKEKNAVRMIAGMPNGSFGAKAYTYRFCPVDDTGALSDETGRSDIYLTLTEKQGASYGLGFEGRTHFLLFCKRTDQPFDITTLRGIYYD